MQSRHTSARPEVTRTRRRNGLVKPVGARSAVQISVGDLVKVVPTHLDPGDPNMLAIAVGHDKRGWVTVEFISEELANDEYEYHYPYHKLRLISKG